MRKHASVSQMSKGETRHSESVSKRCKGWRCSDVGPVPFAGAPHTTENSPPSGRGMEKVQRVSTQRTEGLEIFDGHKLGCSGVSRGKKVFG